MGILRYLHFKIQSRSYFLPAKVMHFLLSMLILGYELSFA